MVQSVTKIQDDRKNIPIGGCRFTIKNVESLDIADVSNARYKLYLHVLDRYDKEHDILVVVHKFQWEALDQISLSVGLRWYRDFGFETDKVIGKSGKFTLGEDKRIVHWNNAYYMDFDDRIKYGEPAVLYDVELKSYEEMINEQNN